MAIDRNILGTVVIDVLLSFNFAAMLYLNLFPFPLATADGIGNGLLNRQCDANI